MNEITIYQYLIDKAIKRLGLNPEKCYQENYNWHLQSGSVILDLSVFLFDGRHYFKVEAEIIAVPTENLTEFYETLLYYNHDFNGFAFLIHDQKVYLKSVRELQGMDENEAFAIITKVGNYADKFDGKLKEKFGY
jgi:hypothetical protein